MPATLPDWIAYAADRGRTVVDDPASSQALTRAADYIRTHYTIRMANPEDPAITEATYIAAAFELDAPGFWGKTYTPSQSKVLTKAGPIEWDVVSTGVTGIQAMMPTSPMIEALLMPYVASRIGVFVV